MATRNEELLERFGRGRKAHQHTSTVHAEVLILPQKLNEAVYDYFFQQATPAHVAPWSVRPEIPTSTELLDLAPGGSTEAVEITANRPTGAWESRNAYLGAHYELLREDATRPLREAVSQVRHSPNANEDAFNGTVGIYEKVRIIGFTCSTRGIATRVTFSIARAGKQIVWEQSKRLISGSVVVLTRATDMFSRGAVVATVAARPLAAVLENPPEIDLFIANEDELEIDPSVEWVMVEARSSLYEANRHTLLALQRMMAEPFPLKEHLISSEASVPSPKYLADKPIIDLSPVIKKNPDQFKKVDVLQAWPSQMETDLDASQLDALRRILTKQLAIVQGPPGTGKTFVSVQAVAIMLANWKDGDPPIVIACQTNHALDQLLRHIARFEPDFVRLGGRSKDREIIKPRTLYEVMRSVSRPPLPGSRFGPAKKRMEILEKELVALIAPLQPSKSPLEPSLLKDFGFLTQTQIDSLERGASQWVQAEKANANETRSPFTVWLARSLIAVPPKPLPEQFGFEFEEADLEFEQLKDIEAENFAKDDEEFDTLFGNSYPLVDNFTCRKEAEVSDSKVKDILAKQQDLWKIPEQMRGSIYRHLQQELKRQLLTSFRVKAKDYNTQARLRLVGKWERNETVLREQKIIGLTTTGLSKYRGLLAALGCKVVLIEEAAETLEAPIIAACLPTLQHLILVGDHKQLRPHCQVKAHEDSPFYLNVSLFERMINNGVEYSTLTRQRRMIPEIRRLLHPIYGNLIQDHPSVLDPNNRPDVPGMGGINSLFFTHQWLEQRDELMSCINEQEAEMVIGFVEYLVYNGMDTEDITVLTFYNGQRKRILSGLRKCQSLAGYTKFNVVTVDSYQGEENKVVLLSLVRSNDKSTIGFLSVDNRVCVALSRAQCGFYIFGNGELLYKFKTWQKVLKIIAFSRNKDEAPKNEPKRLVAQFLVHCKNHNNMTEITHAIDWSEIMGGCKLKCEEMLPCGHRCVLLCHPFSHDTIVCQQNCTRALPCGHTCSAVCSIACICSTCAEKQPKERTPAATRADSGSGRRSEASSDSNPWQDFAAAARKRSASRTSTLPLGSNNPSPHAGKDGTKPAPKKENDTCLVDLTPEPTETHKVSDKTLLLAMEGLRTPSSEKQEPGETGTTTPRKKWVEEWSLLD